MSTDTRQLIVMCDGTNNTLTGGVQDTNVLKLALHLRKSGDPHQMVWYDPGVGSDAALPGVSWFERVQGRIKSWIGLAQGAGVYENIQEALTFLAQHHRDGDHIFVFGFSRGAFTARAIAGLINEYGLPAAHALHLLPMMISRYFSKGKDASKIHLILEDTRLAAQCRHPDVQFVGVWDTVEAIGLPFFSSKKISNSSSVQGKCFLNVRHAVALDEFRSLFKPRLYQPTAGNAYTSRSGKTATLVQKAFAGCHGDVGGGYKRAALSDEALHWMAREAAACGLRIDPLPPPASQPVIHSEIHSFPLWAVTGQSVRDLRSLQSSHLPPLKTRSVWREHGLSEWPWWLWGAVLTALGGLCLARLGSSCAIMFWQTTAMWQGSVASPVDAAVLRQHVLIDTLVFIPGLMLLMSVLCAAAFARAAGRQTLGQKPPAFLNLLGMALPLFALADLAENLFTAVVLAEVGAAVFWIALMSIASACKWLGLLGVGVLWVRGVLGK